MLPLSPAQTHSAFCRIPALLKDPKRWASGTGALQGKDSSRKLAGGAQESQRKKCDPRCLRSQGQSHAGLSPRWARLQKWAGAGRDGVCSLFQGVSWPLVS